MAKMTKEELIEQFDRFINENGLVGAFIESLEQSGYSEEEFETLMRDLDQ